MYEGEHEKMPHPPDLKDSMSSKTGVEHLDECIEDKLVKENADSNQMIVKSMLFDCHQVLSSFWNIVKLFLPTCCVLKKSNGSHIQTNTY